jgi:hypothetical protein
MYLNNNTFNEDHNKYIELIDDTIFFRRFLKEILLIYILYALFCFVILFICKSSYAINILVFFGFIFTMFIIFNIYKEYNIKYNILQPFIMVTILNLIMILIHIFFIKIPIWIQIIWNIIFLMIGIMNSSVYEPNKMLISLGLFCFIIQLLGFFDINREVFLSFGFFCLLK